MGLISFFMWLQLYKKFLNTAGVGSLFQSSHMLGSVSRFKLYQKIPVPFIFFPRLPRRGYLLSTVFVQAYALNISLQFCFMHHMNASHVTSSEATKVGHTLFTIVYRNNYLHCNVVIKILIIIKILCIFSPHQTIMWGCHKMATPCHRLPREWRKTEHGATVLSSNHIRLTNLLTIYLYDWLLSTVTVRDGN